METRRICKGFVLAVYVTLAICWLDAPARAEKLAFSVNSSGNFSIDFTDLSTLGGLQEGIRRVYNSFDNERMGRFGVGWETQAETYVTVEADGSIVIHEYGGGALNAFQPTTLSRRASKDIIDEIMRAAEQTGQFGSEKERSDYLHWLQTGSNEEIAWEKFAGLGLVKQTDPPIGEAFFSGQFYTAYVTRVPEGYQREMKYTGGVLFQAFDVGGRLTRYWDMNHNYISLAYAKNGNIVEASNNLGDRFIFSTTADNRVTRIYHPSAHVVLYQYAPARSAYDERGFDLLSVNVDGRTTRYTYDINDQMTSVTFPDHSSMEIAYDSRERVARVKDTDGTLTTYTYGLSTTQSSEIRTFEEKTRQPSGESHDKLFQYFYDAPAYFRDKEIDTIDGKITTTTYNPNGDKLTVTTSQGTTEYRYDKLDRQIFEKEPAGTTLATQYDPASGNIAVLTITDKSSVLVEQFQYDPEGNIVKAFDTTGHNFNFTYDPHGRIASVGGGALSLTFDYPDARAKQPTTVTMAGVGSVNVSYLSSGDVDKAQSSGGAAVVEKVRTALKTVDDLISDAGFDVVTLPTGEK